jgi:NADH-quinone oxidoreductase subunit E
MLFLKQREGANDLDERDNELERILRESAGAEGSLIEILQKTQGIYGWIPEKAITRISEVTGTKPAKILGVVSFYSQFRLKEAGKHMIMLCQGTACHVNGSEGILSALEDELKVEVGETTPDGLFTLESVACLGCCSLSPVMMIDGVAYGGLTPDSARKIARSLEAGA